MVPVDLITHSGLSDLEALLSGAMIATPRTRRRYGGARHNNALADNSRHLHANASNLRPIINRMVISFSFSIFDIDQLSYPKKFLSLEVPVASFHLHRLVLDKGIPSRYR